MGTPHARLRPGLSLVRRDADHLQLGLDPPYAVVLPDRTEVRDLVSRLAAGRPPGRLGPVAARALAGIERAGLLVPDDVDRRAAAAARFTLRIEAEPQATSWLWDLLGGHGIRQRRHVGAPDLVLLVAEGEVDRARVDVLVREDQAHLVLRERGDRVVVGPFVVPGRSACLRCLDAHASLRDPRRGLVLGQLAERAPLVPWQSDPTVRALGLAAAARDVVTYAEDGVPATWSATLELGADLAAAPYAWRRHPGCGCAWGDALTQTG